MFYRRNFGKILLSIAVLASFKEVVPAEPEKIELKGIVGPEYKKDCDWSKGRTLQDMYVNIIICNKTKKDLYFGMIATAFKAEYQNALRIARAFVKIDTMSIATDKIHNINAPGKEVCRDYDDYHCTNFFRPCGESVELRFALGDIGDRKSKGNGGLVLTYTDPSKIIQSELQQQGPQRHSIMGGLIGLSESEMHTKILGGLKVNRLRTTYALVDKKTANADKAGYNCIVVKDVQGEPVVSKVTYAATLEEAIDQAGCRQEFNWTEVNKKFGKK